MDQSQNIPSRYSLTGIAILAGLRPATLERLRRSCVWRRYEPGESIVGYLDTSDDVFFVTAGKVRVTIYSHAGKIVSFGELGAGEVFGEYAAIDHCPRSASVEALTGCLVALMPANAFRRLRDPDNRLFKDGNARGNMGHPFSSRLSGLTSCSPRLPLRGRVHIPDPRCVLTMRSPRPLKGRFSRRS
jgi:CRP-like cAMP-binding protein